MKWVGMVREWKEVSQIPVSESKVKTVTRGIHYKLAIMNSPKINTLGENCYQFLLAYQNFTKPRLGKRRSKSTTVSIFKLRGAKISDLH